MMVSISTKYWHFLLAQGFLQGLANGFLMFPALATVQQWFNKKRGAAMGCAIAGSSIGGVIFPITLSNLLNKTTLSFGWSVRITGFIMIPFLTFASFAIQNRAPKRKTRFFIPESFKKPMYSLTIASIFFVLVGMFVPLFMLPAYGISHHMSDGMSNYLLAIINGASFFGRVLPGIFSDKLGRLNTLVVAGVTTAILAFCWPLAKTNASIIVFSVFFGFASGAILSSATVALTICAEPANLGTYMGVGMAVASGSALLGPPVSGAMIDQFGGYYEVSYFAGAMTIFGAFLAIAVKYLSPAGILGKA
jgi:MFS family permease